jgi:hypothetical protein
MEELFVVCQVRNEFLCTIEVNLSLKSFELYLVIVEAPAAQV